MKTWFSGKTVVCGLAILLGACGGDDEEDNGGGSGVPGCAEVCAKVAPLMCPGDVPASCESDCGQLAQLKPECASQVRALVACSAARPATDFACVDGESELSDTQCVAETDAVGACVLGGGAGMGGGGAGNECEDAFDGFCDEPDFCAAGTDTADCG
jgi:hypothetical protein